MSTLLNFGRDIQGLDARAPQFATDMFSATLTVSTDTTFTVPSNYENWIVEFSYGNAISDATWVALNTTAAGPAGATFASTKSTLRPFRKKVKAGDVIHLFQTAGTGIVGVQLYAIY